jgi:hypothetical protein
MRLPRLPGSMGLLQLLQLLQLLGLLGLLGWLTVPCAARCVWRRLAGNAGGGFGPAADSLSLLVQRK